MFRRLFVSCAILALATLATPKFSSAQGIRDAIPTTPPTPPAPIILMGTRTVTADGPLTLLNTSKAYGIIPSADVLVTKAKRMTATGTMEQIDGLTLLAGVPVSYLEAEDTILLPPGSKIGTVGFRSEINGNFTLIEAPVVVATPGGPIGLPPTPANNAIGALHDRLAALEEATKPGGAVDRRAQAMANQAKADAITAAKSYTDEQITALSNQIDVKIKTALEAQFKSYIESHPTATATATVVNNSVPTTWVGQTAVQGQTYYYGYQPATGQPVARCGRNGRLFRWGR